MQGKLDNSSVSKRERTIQNVAIRLVGLDDTKYTVMSISKQNVTIKLSGTKNVLKNFKFEDSNTRIVADFTDVQVGKSKLYLSAKGFPSNIDVVIQPNYINVDVEKRGEKQMTVEPKLSGTPLAGYEVTGQVVTPQLVILSGLQSQINRVDHVVAEVDITDLNTSLVGEYTFVAKDENDKKVDVGISPKKGTVKVTLSKSAQGDTSASPSPTASPTPTSTP
jgi:YbbR domain-containing protein